MKIKLILSSEDWSKLILDNKIYTKLNPDRFSTENYKNKTKNTNEEIDRFKEFYSDVKSSTDKNKLFHYNPKLEIFIKVVLDNIIANFKYNDKIVSRLFINNDSKLYYTEIDKINVRNYDYKIRLSDKDETFFAMFKHLVKLSNPLNFQENMEYLKQRYENNEPDDVIQYEFHKMLRQGDVFDNPHIDMLLWNMLQETEIPHKTMKLLVTTKSE